MYFASLSAVTYKYVPTGRIKKWLPLFGGRLVPCFNLSIWLHLFILAPHTNVLSAWKSELIDPQLQIFAVLPSFCSWKAAFHPSRCYFLVYASQLGFSLKFKWWALIWVIIIMIFYCYNAWYFHSSIFSLLQSSSLSINKSTMWEWWQHHFTPTLVPKFFDNSSWHVWLELPLPCTLSSSTAFHSLTTKFVSFSCSFSWETVSNTLLKFTKQ